ncbi:MAG TPA: cytochrome c, partial [Methylomirabilota bacterium]|nr:cytochrome c [Methylomirabilota bacterium]
MVRTLLKNLKSLAALSLLAASLATRAQDDAGLAATFTAGGQSDSTILSNVWLHVPAGEAPTPFLAPGKFQTEWRGFVSVDLRSDYTFTASLNGALKLEINGAVILEGATNGVLTAAKPTRLNKGTNSFVATYTSPASGDARIRVTWIPKEGAAGPIPTSALKPALTPAVERGQQLRLGRHLALEHRCFQCHSDQAPKGQGTPELKMDAPTFEGIGSRRNFAWMAAWIENPHTNRARAQMPQMFHGPAAKANAEAAAAFLASLKATDAPAGSASTAATSEQAEAGQHLFQTLHCAACHTAPDSNENDPTKVSLSQVSAKFTEGSLLAFLKDPAAHYKWIKMPNFKFTDAEAQNVAAFLRSKAPAPKQSPAAPADLVDKGRNIVQTSGCLNCHTAKLENQFKAPAIKLTSEQGCLADAHGSTSKAPRFDLTKEERQAIRAFAATGLSSLERPVAREFASRYAQTLNCAGCHGHIELIPHVDILGGKLRPEWAEEFIAGKVKYKPRPWIEARMPAFPAYAEGLAKGMAAEHGYAPTTPKE